MGDIFSGDKIYFDELAKGISTGLYHDDGLNWDAEGTNVVDMALEVLLGVQKYYSQELLDIDMHLDVTADENYAGFIDLMSLIPETFRDSVSLQEFMDVAGLYAGTWIGYINDLVQLLDPYSVSDEYMQNLADLLHVSLPSPDFVSTAERRRVLLTAIDWYKSKGTYGIFSYLSYLFNINLTIWDLYTNNYTTFVKEPWFSGKTTENPPGLDSSYYKSPHIGLEVVLNQVYGVDPNKHLFLTSMYTDLAPYVDIVRPVNVVPHYSIFLNPQSNETGVAVEIPGEIKTCVIGAWGVSKNYFNQSEVWDIGYSGFGGYSGLPLYFNDGIFFDASNRDAFLNSVTKWKLGIGNKGVSPDVPGWAMETPILAGDISRITIYSDRTEYEFTVVGSSQQGISELGLYMTNGFTLTVGCTFPDIDLDPAVELRVLVIIYK